MTDTCPLDGGHLPHNRTVCTTCTGRLRGLLTDLPGLMTDLDIALTRQARFTPRHGSRSTTTPLPFAYAASEAAWVTRMTLLTWVDWIAAVRGHRTPDTWTTIATYLTGALDWITAHPTGPQIVEELTAALRHARHAIDRPADRTYIGRCGALTEHAAVPADCPEELYARTDRPTTTCPRCGTAWDVSARQETMLEQLRDHLLPAVDVARAVDGLGVDVTPERIRQWKRRGHLEVAIDDQGRPRADVRGRPLYRVGDVLDLVERAASVPGAIIGP